MVYTILQCKKSSNHNTWVASSLIQNVERFASAVVPEMTNLTIVETQLALTVVQPQGTGGLSFEATGHLQEDLSESKVRFTFIFLQSVKLFSSIHVFFRTMGPTFTMSSIFEYYIYIRPSIKLLSFTVPDSFENGGEQNG